MATTQLIKNTSSHFGQMLREHRDQYVDKSLFIGKVLDNEDKVLMMQSALPIGKSLNLSMLQHFLSPCVDGQATAGLFDNLEISNYPNYMQQQGKHHVIYLDFSNLSIQTYQDMCDVLFEKLNQLIDEYHLKDSDHLSDFDRELIDGLLNKKDGDLISGLIIVLKLIKQSLNNEKPVLLIDGFDHLIPKEVIDFDQNSSLLQKLWLKDLTLTGMAYFGTMIFLKHFFLALGNGEDYDRAFITCQDKKYLSLLPSICPIMEIENSPSEMANYFGFNSEDIKNLNTRYQLHNYNFENDIKWLKPAFLKANTPIFTRQTVADFLQTELNILIGHAVQGDLNEVKRLLSLGADINTHNAGRRNDAGPKVPLVIAANAAQSEIVKYLLAHGANVNAKAVYDRTALLYAVSDHTGARKEAYLDSMKQLIEAGADINACDNRGMTILMHAVDSNNLPAVEWLLKKGADVKAKDEDGCSALHHIYYQPNETTYRICELLIQAGADINVVNKDGKNILAEVAKSSKNSQIVDLLLRSGADKSSLFEDGKTELMYACLWNDKEWAKKIIDEHKNDIDDYLAKQDKNGTSALMYASAANIELVKLILKASKQRKITDQWSHSLLYQQDNGGNTALFYAYGSTFNYLINAGSDINHVTKSNHTAFHHAMDFHIFNAIDLLFAKRIKKEILNVKSNPSGFYDGETVLFQAVSRANESLGTYYNKDEFRKIALRLLKAGADPNIECSGQSVYDICYDKALKGYLKAMQNPVSKTASVAKFSFLNKMPADVSDEQMAQSDFAVKPMR